MASKIPKEQAETAADPHIYLYRLAVLKWGIKKPHYKLLKKLGWVLHGGILTDLGKTKIEEAKRIAKERERNAKG